MVRAAEGLLCLQKFRTTGVSQSQAAAKAGSATTGLASCRGMGTGLFGLAYNRAGADEKSDGCCPITGEPTSDFLVAEDADGIFACVDSMAEHPKIYGGVSSPWAPSF
jgi:hypothetical protein